ncbi:TonB-dependent receptor plug domain-containing protein [Edaphobacter flagellatus]|uniref:TonB-dependent receptor plug domain-containing protein n=1 Tax=Edaphobacter flagellatus TaxID=1933044 RepID=UPI0021B4891A|nr:TonB-dependent receptor plug domain-containing protein [Edaphobacter flagellatus]
MLDEAAQPLSGAQISVSDSGILLSKAVTDGSGHASFQCSPHRTCIVTVDLKGYQPLELPAQDTETNLEIHLIKTLEHTEVVEVQAESSNPLAEAQSGENKLSIPEATRTPLRPATLADALPLIPGVIRAPDGQVNIAGLGEQHSVLIVNAVDVTDPATGNFGLSVPIDSVQTVKVLQSPYLAEYGNFTAGVVSAETRRGGEKWLYSLNDPMPEVRIRSGHLVGLRAVTPRLNLSGPLIRNHLYVLEASEYLMHKNPVRTLPFPFNETKSNAFNSFTQLDAPLTAKQTFTATLHFAPRNVHYMNLNFFDPQPVTPDANYQEDTGTLTHRLAFAGGLLTSTYAYTRVASNIVPQTPGEMTLSPIGDTGNYFSEQSGESTRIQWIETWTPKVFSWHGQHALQAGGVIAHAEDEGSILDRPVHLTDAMGRSLQDIIYSGQGGYQLSDMEPAVYFQDHWIATQRLAFDAGVRWEAQSITSTNRAAPRVGFTWTPSKDSRTTIVRGGMGVFYDEVPLNVYAFRNYPQQTVTTYDSTGNVSDGPRLFYNVVDTNPNAHFPLIDQEASSGNFAPYSLAWTVEAEHTLRSFSTFRLRYMQSDRSNQLTLRSEVSPTLSALVLAGSGSGRIRQIEFTSGFGTNESRHLYFSYVRQYSRGTLTDVAGYLGAYRYPVVRSLDKASNAGEIPNRFLLWGTFALPYRMNVSPHIEYRDGFVYQPTNVFQQYVVLSNSLQPRYPRYFSLDARVSKDLNMGSKHAVRLSLSGINLMNHSNYLQVHNNTGDPQFGKFFGNYGRHLLIDFDFLF